MRSPQSPDIRDLSTVLAGGYPTIIGHGRVSRIDQDLSIQEAALKAGSCHVIRGALSVRLRSQVHQAVGAAGFENRAYGEPKRPKVAARMPAASTKSPANSGSNTPPGA
jgi:hypothetical protein